MGWNKFLEIYRDVIGRGAGAGWISDELLALPGRCARTDRCLMSAAPGGDHKDAPDPKATFVNPFRYPVADIRGNQR
jgi:hypothetical protein